MNQSMLADQIADEVIEELFMNGEGGKARRLVLELENGLNGDGWSKHGARSHIVEIIKKRLARDGEAKEV
ncbi:MAG: hypothetical protein A2029_01385 [Chloroflexi bacterium RBG_19FT_COMBO_47_9]|nr:MAG: hypothetical protein A2W25_05075 [candidate division Zixibacteria bacterium RBG_16_53_22]OGO66561.1 MAG: hypothetical protein A2029_01385 [Chloroflexi bacterium RBG_19FT_COMBO_47_9]